LVYENANPREQQSNNPPVAPCFWVRIVAFPSSFPNHLHHNLQNPFLILSSRVKMPMEWAGLSEMQTSWMTLLLCLFELRTVVQGFDIPKQMRCTTGAHRMSDLND
jgi:hypothetical protein